MTWVLSNVAHITERSSGCGQVQLENLQKTILHYLGCIQTASVRQLDFENWQILRAVGLQMAVRLT